MNEKAKRPGREDILDVFRSHGDHDMSAENYQLKKSLLSHSATGPVRRNQMTDAAGPAAAKADEPQTLALSGADTADTASDPAIAASGVTDEPQQPAPIRLQTLRIDMQERLAAMQVAQQKAKDQLNEFKKQNPPADEPPAE